MPRNYNKTGSPGFKTAGASATIRAEFLNIETGFTGIELEMTTEASTRTAQDALKAPLDSPLFSGTPRSVNPTPGTATNQIATCAFVSQAAITATIPTTGADNGKVMTAVAGAPVWQTITTLTLDQIQATALSF